MSAIREIVVQTETSLPEHIPTGFIPEYAAMRNLAVAEHIAPLIGAEVRADGSGAVGDGAYYIPDRPLLRDRAASLGIRDEHDLFGGVVAARLHHDKAILHSLVGADAQGNESYSSQFASGVQGSVLPGYTVFSADDAFRAYNALCDQGYKVRWKDPCGEGGNGQAVIRSEARLRELLAATDPREVAAFGVVFEPHLQDPLTLSVGMISLGGNLYSYHGFQTQTPLEDITTYGGTTLTMVRGGFADLYRATEEPDVQVAVGQACAVYEAYSWYDPILSRTNFDVVQGNDGKGEFLSGVVDQSLRIGGASPAEVIAIEALEADTSLSRVTTQVEISWDQPNTPLAAGDVAFFDHPRRRDVARVLAR